MSLATEFDDFMAAGLADLAPRLGPISFLLEDQTFMGDWNEDAVTRLPAEDGGYVEIRASTLVCTLDQLAGAEPAVGQKITIFGGKRRIARVGRDSIAWTLLLSEPER